MNERYSVWYEGGRFRIAASHSEIGRDWDSCADPMCTLQIRRSLSAEDWAMIRRWSRDHKPPCRDHHRCLVEVIR